MRAYILFTHSFMGSWRPKAILASSFWRKLHIFKKVNTLFPFKRPGFAQLQRKCLLFGVMYSLNHRRVNGEPKAPVRQKCKNGKSAAEI